MMASKATAVGWVLLDVPGGKYHYKIVIESGQFQLTTMVCFNNAYTSYFQLMLFFVLQYK